MLWQMTTTKQMEPADKTDVVTPNFEVRETLTEKQQPKQVIQLRMQSWKQFKKKLFHKSTSENRLYLLEDSKRTMADLC